MADLLTPDLLDDTQRLMIDFVHEHPKCALWVDMGEGKTIATLTTVDGLLNCAEARRVLVIAPLRVAKTTWPDEIKKWSHVRGNTYQILCGSEATRKARLQVPADLYFINRENTVWLVDQFRNKKWPFDTIIIDEASSFRNHSSKRFKALRKVTPHTRRVIELTGTPAPKGKDGHADLLSIWAQIFLLDGGERLGKTFTGYRNAYFTSDFHGFTWTPNPDAEKIIMDRIKDIVLSVKPRPKPKPRHEIIGVELPKKAREIYRELEIEFIAQVEDETVEAVNAAVLTNKLRQAANGALYVDDNGAFKAIHEEKLNALNDIIERHEGENILVAYSYKSDLQRVLDRFPQAEVLTSDPDVVHRWNDRKISLLLAHPASAGHGLNLQHGGRIGVWIGDTWDLELFLQFNARLPRRGQTGEVIFYHIHAQNTVDNIVWQTLGNREKSQKRIIKQVVKDVKSRET